MQDPLGIGKTGFEPATSCSQSMHSNQTELLSDNITSNEGRGNRTLGHKESDALPLGYTTTKLRKGNRTLGH